MTMKATGQVSIREDRSVPGGGHAEIRITGVKAGDARANFYVRRLDYEKNNLGPEGWQGPEAEWTPLSVRQEGYDVVVRIGPDVVDRLEVGTPVEIEFPSLGVKSTAPWPDIAPSAYSRAGRSRTPARRTRTRQPPPPPPVVVVPPEPEPEPEPLPPVRPHLVAPADGNGADADDERRSRGRGWAVAFGVLLVLLLAGGAGAYVVLNDDDLRRQVAEWFPFLGLETEVAGDPLDEGPTPAADDPAQAGVDDDLGPVEPVEPPPAVAETPIPGPAPAADDNQEGPVPEPPVAGPVSPPVAALPAGLPCESPPTPWAECVRQIVAEAASDDEIFQIAQAYQDADHPQMAIGLFRELTRRQLAEAVREIGKMYDPRFYTPESSAFSRPYPDRAISYYRQAEGAGDGEATELLDTLRQWLQQQADQGNAEAQQLLSTQFQ